jgi:steroid 5-alpha reductase family enzyme
MEYYRNYMGIVVATNDMRNRVFTVRVVIILLVVHVLLFTVPVVTSTFVTSSPSSSLLVATTKTKKKTIMSLLQQRHRTSYDSSKQSPTPQPSLQNQPQQHSQSHRTTTTTSTELSFSPLSSILRHGSTTHTATTTNLWIFACTNLLGCIITFLYPYSHYHVDLLGTGAFAISGWYTLLRHPTNTRIVYSSIAVILWSCRLVSFLLYRIIQQQGHDARLTPVLSVPSSAIGFWCISALWGMICSIPHWIGIIPSDRIGSTTTLFIGMITFLIGFLIETTADAQKWLFKQTSNQFCNVGLWSITQHPNWFGNLVLWIGIFLMNSSSYILVPPPSSTISMMKSTNTLLQQCISFMYRYHRFVLASLGPIFMYLLFYSQATGVILGDTLQANQKKYGYGANQEYTNYIDNTPLIVPNIPKRLAQWMRSR